MNSVYLVAAAGAGKTTHIVNLSLEIRDKPCAIITFTNQNEDGIRKKIFAKCGFIPSHITVKSLFAFLMQHGVKPYQGKLRKERIKGLHLVNEKSGLKSRSGKYPIYWSESDVNHHYFNTKGQIFSDKIAKFVCRCNEASKGLVVERIATLFPIIFIDEVQDFAGYDLEFLKILLKAGVVLICVGDPRQTTYRTHYDPKYTKYKGINLKQFFACECKKLKISIDQTLLNISHRCNDRIVTVSSKLYPSLPVPKHGRTSSNDLDGVHIISLSSVDKYIELFHPMQLRYDKSNKHVRTNAPSINIGKSKGMEYERVLIFPTKAMAAWLIDHTVNLSEDIRSKLYVAITRARTSAAIVLLDKEFAKHCPSRSLSEIPCILIN